MHCTPKSGWKSGFTLAELLVVVAIVGILFAIALPALNSITGQSKIDAAANAVHAAAKLARQHAITHNQPTYLVFHDDQSTSDPNLAFRAYAVFTINIHTNADPIPQSAGEFITGWETLPAGVVFDIEPTDGQSNVFIPSNQTWDGGFNRNRQITIGNIAYVALGFRPHDLPYLTHKNDIHLAEGFYENGNLVRTSDQGYRIRIEGTQHSRITALHYNETGTPEEIAR